MHPTPVELGPAHVWHSDRHGGVSRSPYATANVGAHVGDDRSAVDENRRRLARAAGLPDPDEWVWLNQVHGIVVHVADAPTRTAPDADAAVTAMPGLPLAILTADCAPIVLASDDAVGVVHAGHRGLAAGVVERAVAALASVGHGRIRAFLGPCIRPERYEFGRGDLERVAAALGPEVVSVTADGRPALDIPTAVRVVLTRAGVDDLDDCGICTASSPDHFSYRRDGTTGRQATVVVLP